MSTAMAMDEVEHDDEEREAEPRKMKAPPPRPTPRGTTAKGVVNQEFADDARDIVDWLRGLAPDGAVQVRISRRRPKNGPNGEKIDGVLETLDERIDEEYIRERWGGGTFLIQVRLPGPTGSYQWGPSKTVDIGGDPKMEGVLLVRGQVPNAGGTAAGDPLAERAIQGAERFADQERKRAERLERELEEERRGRGQLDHAAIEALVAPMRQQVSDLMTERRDLQERLFAQVTRPPPTDTFRDQILQNAVAGESKQLRDQQERYEQRLDKMRDEHAAELRQIRQSHGDDMKRLEQRHDTALADYKRQHERELEDLKRNHAREVAHIEKANDNAAKALDVANDTRVTALKSENTRLTAELAQVKGELGTLRDRKDKSPVDQLKDLAAIKQNLDDLTGGGSGDDGDKPWYERLAGALANSDGLMRVIDRIGGGGDDDDGDDAVEGPAPAPAQVTHPPVGSVVRNPEDGQLYQHVGNGNYRGPYTEQEIQQAAAVKQQRHAAQLAKRQQIAAQRRQRQVAAAAPSTAPPGATPPSAVAEGLEALPDADASAAQPPDATAAAVTAATEQASETSPPRAPRPLRPLPAPSAPRRPRGKPPSAEDIRAAVGFLEGAIGSRSSNPEAVARTAKSLVPASTLQYIQDVGIDPFLAMVAKEKPSSSLCTQHGRSFVRQVAKFLFAPST